MASAEVHGNRTGEARKSAAPRMVRGAVRTGMGVGQMVRQIWLAGLGAMAATGEEGAHLFRTLVERGEAVEPNLNVGWNKIRDEVTSKMRWAGEQVRTEGEEIASGQDERLLSRLKRMRVPDHAEMERLARRVEELTARVEELSRSRPATARKRSAAPSQAAAATRTRARRAPARTGR